MCISSTRRKVVRKELQTFPRNKNSFIHSLPPPASYHFLCGAGPFLSKKDVNDLINILNNNIGKPDISQSFFGQMIKVMKFASYSGQAYQGLKSTHCLKGQVN